MKILNKRIKNIISKVLIIMMFMSIMPNSLYALELEDIGSDNSEHIEVITDDDIIIIQDSISTENTLDKSKMSEDEIKAALSVEIGLSSNACGTDAYTVRLLWNDEVISEDEQEINNGCI